MDISIVIPSFDAQATIGRTLASLAAQETDRSFEIIVVDCSDHDRVARVVEEHPKARYEHRQERFNPGEGRNIGAALAQGELLVFLDADVCPAPTALAAAWRHFRAGRKVFGGALELDRDAAAGPASYLEHYFFNHESQPGRPLRERRNLSSAMAFFDRQLFEETGGFRDIPRMQDTELTERLRRGGTTLWFCPDIVALQTQDSPYGKVLRKIYINGQNLYHIRYRDGITPGRRAAFFLLLPLITLAKTGRIIARHLVYQTNRGRLMTLLTTPSLLLGGFLWMVGFYKALAGREGMGRER